MFIRDVVNSGAMPALEMTMRFASQRQRLIAGNIANLSTPNFVPMDVDPRGFQRELGRAMDERDRRGGGALAWRGSDEVRLRSDGSMELRPRTPSGNILFHDRNNRDVERLMQSHVENLTTFRVATDLLRSRMQMLREAMAERV